MKIDPRIRQMARERVARDCAERGVPVKIQDPTIYTALAKLVSGPVDRDAVRVEGLPTTDGVRRDLDRVDQKPDELAGPLVPALVPQRLEVIAGKDAGQDAGAAALDELGLEGTSRLSAGLLGCDQLGGR